MAQWTLLSAVILLARSAIADILVQPGYAQPHSTLNPIVQPPSTLPRAMEQEDFQQQQELLNPGYHLELHPVYGMHQVPPDAQIPYSYLTRAAQRRLNSGRLADLGVVGLSVTAPAALGHQYLPMAVHSRHRRSSGDKANAGVQSKGSDKANVASKSSLNKDVLPVIDLQSQDGEVTKNIDEKRVEVRHSVADTLLGLNPSNMYPVYHQYRSMDSIQPNPAFASNLHIIGDQMQQTSQVNSRSTTQGQQAMHNQVATPTQAAGLRVNLLKLQHPVPQQQSNQQQQIFQNSVGQEQRNAPDPRPVSHQLIKNKAPSDHSGSQMSANARHSDANTVKLINDPEIVGNKHNRIKVHVHGNYDIPAPIPAPNPSLPAPAPTNIPQSIPSTIPSTIPAAVPTTYSAVVPATIPAAVPIAVPVAVPEFIPEPIPEMVPEIVPIENRGCPCANVVNIAQSRSSSNPLHARTSAHSMIRAYPAQATSYTPNANYVLLPQTYTNYVSNALNYPSASTFRLCLHNFDDTQSAMY